MLLAAAMFWIALCGKSPGAERPTVMQLLPQATLAFAAADVRELAGRFQLTAPGQLFQDPAVRPLVDQLYGQLVEAARPVMDRLELTPAELWQIPQGEMAIAVVDLAERAPAVVLMADVDPQSPLFKKLVDNLGRALQGVGAIDQSETVDDRRLTVFSFDTRGSLQIAWCELDNRLVIATRVESLHGILKAHRGQGGESLAQNASLGAIWRQMGDVGQEKGLLTWFVDPIALARAAGRRNAAAQIGLAVIPTLGLDGITAAGGSVALATETFDSLSQWHVLLDTPRAGAVDVIAMRAGDPTPPSWVPQQVATYTTVYWDAEQSYRQIGKLVDSFQGPGAFARQVRQRALDRFNVDLEEDLLPALAGRFTHFALVEKPYDAASQGHLLGIHLRDGRKFQPVLDRLRERLADKLESQSYAGHTYYRALGKEATADEKRPRQASLTILGDDLLVADRASLIELAILTARDSSQSLAESLEFKLVLSKAKRYQPEGQFGLLTFTRPDEGLRLMHALAGSEESERWLTKQGEKNPVIRGLGTALRAQPLPPFQVIEPYLAPSGAVIVDDETGLHHRAFTLRRAASEKN